MVALVAGMCLVIGMGVVTGMVLVKFEVDVSTATWVTFEVAMAVLG